jgi:rod shape-determining protein MreD
MKKMIFYLLLLLAFILQSTVLQFLTVYGVTINITLVMLVVMSLQTNELYGGSLGLMLGMLNDLMYYQSFGINSLIFLIIGFTLGSLSENVYKFDLLTNFYFTVAATVVFHLLFYVINYFLKIDAASIIYMLRPILIELVLNVIILMPILKLQRYLFKEMNIKFE